MAWCLAVGIDLDPWQQDALRLMLAEDSRGRWACFEFALVVARQNGKGELLMARELVGLGLLEEPLILHTAHEFKTAEESFIRVQMAIEASPALQARVRRVLTGNSKEVEFKNGCRLKFLARSTSSGLGFTADTVIWDEAQRLGDGPVRAMLPTLSAVPNPQLIYTGSAGGPESVQLARVRRRAIEGGDAAGSLGYMEWSVDPEDFKPGDPRCWAQANPTMGIRISEEHIANEFATMSPDGFASERLSVGDWPTDTDSRVIPADVWHACAEPNAPRPQPPLVFSVDVTPMRNSAAVAVAGLRADQLIGVEIAAHGPGLDWVVGECRRMDAERLPDCWVIDQGGPAGTLVQPLRDAGLTVVVPSSQEVAQAAGGFYDLVMNGELRHTADVPLTVAVAGAERRRAGDAWAWGRRQSSCDISPLVAASLAVWGCKTRMVEGFAPSDITIL